MSEGVNEVLENLRKLVRCGIQFVSYTEEHFRTNGPAGTLVMPIAAWIAQQERILISARTKAALAMARAEGKRLGRPRRIFPFRAVAVDRQSGMSECLLEQKYGIPQSILRNATPSLTEAAVPMPLETGDPYMCTRKNRNEQGDPVRRRGVGEVESSGA